MRILHVISSMEIGGAQRLLSELLPLLTRDHEVSLLIDVNRENSLTNAVRDAGVEIISLELPNIHSIGNIKAVRKVIGGYDIVNVHLFPMLYWVAFASVFLNVPLVYTEHSTNNRRRRKWFLRPIEQLVYKRYNKVIAISDKARTSLISWLKIKEDVNKIEVINNGIRLESYQEIAKQRICPRTIMMVSRFTPAKDQNTVIRAMVLLSEEVHLIFVGDGALKIVSESLAKELNLGHRVHFVGEQTNIKEWIGKADVGIQSSHWEGFPLATLEFMAAGIPVVASEVDGLRQLVEGAGLLFPEGDEKKLAQVIGNVLNDQKLYEKLSDASITRAAMYDISKTAEQYVASYRALLK